MTCITSIINNFWRKRNLGKSSYTRFWYLRTYYRFTRWIDYQRYESYWKTVLWNRVVSYIKLFKEVICIVSWGTTPRMFICIYLLSDKIRRPYFDARPVKSDTGRWCSVKNTIIANPLLVTTFKFFWKLYSRSFKHTLSIMYDTCLTPLKSTGRHPSYYLNTFRTVDSPSVDLNNINV